MILQPSRLGCGSAGFWNSWRIDIFKGLWVAAWIDFNFMYLKEYRWRWVFNCSTIVVTIQYWALAGQQVRGPPWTSRRSVRRPSWAAPASPSSSRARRCRPASRGSAPPPGPRTGSRARTSGNRTVLKSLSNSVIELFGWKSLVLNETGRKPSEPL